MIFNFYFSKDWSKTVFEVFFLDLMAFPMRINVRPKIPQFFIFSNRHTDATSPIGKIHPFSKIVVTLEPVMQF